MLTICRMGILVLQMAAKFAVYGALRERDPDGDRLQAGEPSFPPLHIQGDTDQIRILRSCPQLAASSWES